jgi:hypothetical protein
MFHSCRNLQALKAPSVASLGQRPGFWNPSMIARPERAQVPSALSGRTMTLAEIPGALARATQLRAVGATTCYRFLEDKTVAKRFMK